MSETTPHEDHALLTAEELTERSGRLGLLEYWYERKELEAPARKAVPFCWRWKDIFPLLSVAAKTVPIEMASRRALLLANPGMAPRPFMTSTLYAGCSLYNPGEVAEVHRHMSSASRFVLSGDGGYTAIDGEKCTMNRGDLIINPNGAWHDHGNDGKEPIIWVDVLDLPLAENLNASYFDFDYSEGVDSSNTGQRIKRHNQTVYRPVNYSSRLYGAGGLVPRLASHKRAKGLGSPMYVYRWADTYRTLDGLRGVFEDPRDGIIVEYSDPVRGGSVLPTMSFRAQLLAPGRTMEWQRQNASVFFCVEKGRGRIELEDSVIEWEENDMFIVPSWHWYRLVNASASEDAILYSVSDVPALEKLGYYRLQGRGADDKAVEITPWSED